MTPEQLKSQARRLMQEVFVQGDFAVADQLVAADYAHHVPGPQPRPGVEGLTDWVGYMREVIPDLHVIIEDEIAEGDRVVQRLTVRGTPRGEFMGIEATGRPVEFEVIDINRAGPDGRFVEHWSSVDLLGLQEQLGGGVVTTTETSRPGGRGRAPRRRGARFGWGRLQVAAALAAIVSLVVPQILAGEVSGFLLGLTIPFVVGLLVRARWPRTGIVWLGVVSLGELCLGRSVLRRGAAPPRVPRRLPPAGPLHAGDAGGIGRDRARLPRGAPPCCGRAHARRRGVVERGRARRRDRAVAGRRGRRRERPAEPGDLIVTATDFTFGDAAVAAPAGDVAIAVTNTGSTRHTFTIDELGVDLDVPPGTTQRVTFDADAGTYRFYCRPHAPAMEGGSPSAERPAGSREAAVKSPENHPPPPTGISLAMLKFIQKRTNLVMAVLVAVVSVITLSAARAEEEHGPYFGDGNVPACAGRDGGGAGGRHREPGLLAGEHRDPGLPPHAHRHERARLAGGRRARHGAGLAGRPSATCASCARPIEMWEGGIDYLARQMELDWLAEGMNFHITVDAVDVDAATAASSPPTRSSTPRSS